MPNTGRITLCPYYRDEKNLSISCEDTFRRFRWPAQKKRHMDMYCDKDWKACPYAQELDKLYEEFTGGKMDEVTKLRHEVEVLKGELRKEATMLGKRDSAIKRKDKRIRELENEKRALEQIATRQRALLREEREKGEKGAEEFKEIARHYEARFAYLISVFAGGRLDEIAFLEWARTHEFAIQPDEMCEVGDRKITSGWSVLVNEIKEEKENGEV